MTRYLIILLLLAGSAMGGMHTVTSLPYSIGDLSHSADAVDTIEIAGTKLTSGTNGIKLYGEYHAPVRDWFINLGTDTIEFAADSLGVVIDGEGVYHSQYNYGLFIDGHTGSPTDPDWLYSQNITIEGGTIICTPYNREDSICSFNNTCLAIAAEGVYVHNTNLIADGFNGKCLSGVGTGDAGRYDVEIDGGTYTSRVTHFKSRCQFDAAMVRFNYPFDTAVGNLMGYTYNAIIHDVTITGAPHAGIRVDGGTGSQKGIYKVYDCNIQIDARNDLYTSYEGVCASAANAYGIATQYLGPGSEIYGDTIVSGTTYGGGRGILCEQLIGTAASPVLIYDNYVNVHEGPNAEYGNADADVHGLRIRYSCQYVNIYDNEIYAVGDNDTSTHSYSPSIMALRYSFGGEGQDEGITQSNVTIENNHFKATSLTSGASSMAVCWDECIVNDTTLIIRNNNIESDEIVVRWAEYNNAGRYITMIGDTLGFLTPSYDPITFYLGYAGMTTWDGTNNKVRDAVYQGGAAYDDITFDNAGTYDIAIQRTLNIVVNGNNGLPVSGAIVTVKNNYGNTVITDTTDANGIASGVATYWWESRSVADSTGYNDFIVEAQNNTDSTLDTITVSATTDTLTLTLLNSATNFSIGNPILVGDPNRTSSDLLLALPRRKAAYNGNTFYLLTNQSGTSSPHWFYSNDNCSTWDTVYANIETDGYIDYHCGIWYAGGIHFTSPVSGTFYRYIRPPCTTSGNLSSYYTFGSDASIRSVVVATDSNNVWLFYRTTATYDNPRYIHTINRFSSIADSGMVWDADTIGSAIRIGATLDDANNPILFTYRYNQGIYQSKWNGSGFTTSTIATGVFGPSGRTITINYQSGLHVFQSGGTQITHWWDSAGTGTIKCDTPTTGTILPDAIISTTRGNQVFLFYGVGSPADSSLAVKIWTGYSWLDDSLIVDGRDGDIHIGNIQALDKIGTDKNFVPVWYYNISTDLLYVTKVLISSSSPALSSVDVDSLHNDYSSELDSIVLSFTSGATTADSVIWCYSQTIYPDSSSSGTTTRKATAHAVSTTVSDTIIVNGTEPYNIYASFWTRTGDVWSARQTATYSFSEVVANDLSWVDSSTSSVKIINVYSGNADSAAYYYDTSIDFTDTVLFDVRTHASPDTVTITGLSAATTYYVLCLLYTNDAVGDSDYIETKTKAAGIVRKLRGIKK